MPATQDFNLDEVLRHCAESIERFKTGLRSQISPIIDELVMASKARDEYKVRDCLTALLIILKSNGLA